MGMQLLHPEEAKMKRFELLPQWEWVQCNRAGAEVYRVRILHTDPNIPERETSSLPTAPHPTTFLTRRHKSSKPTSKTSRWLLLTPIPV